MPDNSTAKQRNKYAAGLYIAFVVSAVFVAVEALGVLDMFELKSLDLRFKLRGPIKAHPDVIMVDIADDAIEEFGQWPFARHFHGMFIDAANSLGASEIVFDIYFSKPTNEESDQFLAQMASEAENVFFPLKFFPHQVDERIMADTAADRMINRFALIQKPGPNDKGVYEASAMLDAPLESIADAACGMGFINTRHDVDGVSRRTPAALKYNNKYFLQLCLPAIARYYGVEANKIKVFPGKCLIIPDAQDGYENDDIVIPLDKQSNIIINWTGTWTDLKHYSYRDILLSYKLFAEGQEPILPIEELRSLAGKILVIGHVERGSHDYYPTPLEKQYFLPGLQINLISTILNRNFISRPGLLLQAMLIILLCVWIANIIYFTPPQFRHISSLAFLGLFLVCCYFAFARYNVWLNAVTPSLAIVFTFGSIVFERYLYELKTKKQVKLAFQKYVTQDVMNQLLAHPEQLQPVGEKKELTIFFSDIRGFTSMSEKLSPEAVVERLNEYLGIMTEIIFRYNGTIDKFVGDEIMAYFGAPLYPEQHAQRAVQAAVEMKRIMEELERKWEAEGKPAIHIGIGINTGDVVMGNIGSEQYMDFTLIGDNVNLGARLCSAAKAGEILLSPSTYRQVSGSVEVVHSEEISVKGKAKPIRVYSVVNYMDAAETERRRSRRREAEITIKAKPADSHESFEEIIVNISAGGFRMNADRAFAVGSNLIVHIPLPNRIIIENAVARVLSCDSRGEGVWQIRTHFIDISDHDRDEIIKFVYSRAD